MGAAASSATGDETGAPLWKLPLLEVGRSLAASGVVSGAVSVGTSIGTAVSGRINGPLAPQPARVARTATESAMRRDLFMAGV